MDNNIKGDRCYVNPKVHTVYLIYPWLLIALQVTTICKI